MVIRAPGRDDSIPLCDVDENTKRRSPKGSAQLSARGEGWHKKVIKAGPPEKRSVSRAIAVGDFQLDIRQLSVKLVTGFKSYQLKVKEIINYPKSSSLPMHLSIDLLDDHFTMRPTPLPRQRTANVTLKSTTSTSKNLILVIGEMFAKIDSLLVAL